MSRSGRIGRKRVMDEYMGGALAGRNKGDSFVPRPISGWPGVLMSALGGKQTFAGACCKLVWFVTNICLDLTPMVLKRSVAGERGTNGGNFSQLRSRGPGSRGKDCGRSRKGRPQRLVGPAHRRRRRIQCGNRGGASRSERGGRRLVQGIGEIPVGSRRSCR